MAVIENDFDFDENDELETSAAESVFFPLNKKAIANTTQMTLNVDAVMIDQLDFVGDFREVMSVLCADSSK